ncbi:replication-associated protein [Poaceae associated gemycircularvirus 1]|uniref:Replication-associated protein n=1 Tax=Poaceae associated gemycircularvirus 1 TaxID=1985392 RepID=A0A0M4FPP3_9VIRU|nr:replication-associated protein [Poaceae associated gemycircularvirus 1]ALC76163.1 replication-associated protein [Poaceae associated gemycircularvirus 1]ALC76166.1 replication-associated protein [Poaceae associated gemycircularvirus 1]ALC76169.1 replication-associated protein [Poaceae associated gemycircularvirus 1]
MTHFIFSARYVLLTYAQSGDLSEWDILDHISSLGAECIIGREDHADGGTHLHVFVDFGRKKQSRRSDFFDVGGHHPNITPSRGRPECGYDYAIKDGDVVAGGLARPGGGGLPSLADKWRTIVSAESREEFFDLLRELDPKTLVTRWSELCRYADHAYESKPEPYVGPSGVEFELGMVPELVRWRGDTLADDSELEAWAHTCIQWESCRDMFCCGTCREVNYAVFDDMRGGIGMFPSFKEWLGAQAVVSVKKLYRDPVQVPWGRPCIWLSNADPRDQIKSGLSDRSSRGQIELVENDIAWLEDNCIFVELLEPIFRASIG